MAEHAHNFSNTSRSIGRSVRKVVLRNSTLRYGENKPVDVRVTDLSTTGFSVEAALDLDLEIGAIVRLGLGGAGTASARIVRRAHSTYGAQFVQPLAADRVDAAFKYSEILALINGADDGAIGDEPADDHSGSDESVDAYGLGEQGRLSRRTRLVVMAASGSLAWAAVVLVWLAL